MNKFSEEVMSSIPNAIACSIDVYHESKKQLLPTAATPQYIFCIKDLSKVRDCGVHNVLSVDYIMHT